MTKSVLFATALCMYMLLLASLYPTVAGDPEYCVRPSDQDCPHIVQLAEKYLKDVPVTCGNPKYKLMVCQGNDQWKTIYLQKP